jgi:hypothetical protein
MRWIVANTTVSPTTTTNHQQVLWLQRRQLLPQP